MSTDNFFVRLFDPIFQFLFGWALNINLLFGICFIGLSVTVFTTLIYKYTTNQELLKKSRESTKELQKQIKETKDMEKLRVLHEQLQQHSFDSLKQNFKPMLITFIPTALIFVWLNTHLVDTGKIFFGLFGWFGTYLISTILFNLLLRKLLKVY